MKRDFNHTNTVLADFQPNAVNDKSSERLASVPKALQHFDSLPNSAFVRLPVVLGLFGISRATVWRYVQKQVLPAPQKFDGHIVVWKVGDLRKVLQH